MEVKDIVCALALHEQQGFTKFTQLHVMASQFAMVTPCALCVWIKFKIELG